MPTPLPVKRTWCKTCQDFTIHKTRINGTDSDKFSSTNCETCDTDFQPYYLSEVPVDKKESQQNRYKEYKTQEFKGMMNYFQHMGATDSKYMFGSDGPQSHTNIKEDDAGQEDIWEAERQEREAKRNAEIEFKARYRGAQRNEKCPCGSGLKYKKCCLPKVEKIR